jgi:ribosomal protein L11 methyltransferase
MTEERPDRWLVVSVARPDDPAVAEGVVSLLLEYAERGVEERESEFVIYLPPPPEGAEAFESALRGGLRELLDGPEAGLEMRWQPHEEWAETWRRGLAPRRITSRIVVSPSWADPGIRPGEVLVTIDPGMAFGTAEHPTTRGSLRLLDTLVSPGDRIADIGAGSGILSIAAARLGAAEVVAVEMDAWSCEVARENAELNGVEGLIRVIDMAIGPEFLPGEPPFSGIVANIESGVLTGLLSGLAGGLSPGGWMILSGILGHEAAEIVEAARAHGLRVTSVDREGGWWTGAFRSA